MNEDELSIPKLKSLEIRLTKDEVKYLMRNKGPVPIGIAS